MPWSASGFQQYIDRFQSGLEKQDHPLYVLGNHDVPRFSSSVGPQAARTGAMLLTTLPGISVLYYGDEVGMENITVSEEERRDFQGRDQSRSPMQWANEPNAGFSDAEPWLPVADNYETKNVETQLGDPGSLLSLYKDLIQLRRRIPALTEGSYGEGIRSDHKDVLSFTRCHQEEKYLIILNFGGEEVPINEELDKAELVISTDPHRQALTDNTLKPYEGWLLRL